MQPWHVHADRFSLDQALLNIGDYPLIWMARVADKLRNITELGKLDFIDDPSACHSYGNVRQDGKRKHARPAHPTASQKPAPPGPSQSANFTMTKFLHEA